MSEDKIVMVYGEGREALQTMQKIAEADAVAEMMETNEGTSYWIVKDRWGDSQGTMVSEEVFNIDFKDYRVVVGA